MHSFKKTLLFSALCVAMAILLLGYSAYGWMTMQRNVRAVGENISISAPSNLLISLSPDGGWAENVEVDMSTLVKELTLPDAPNNYTGGVFYLLPASSLSGAEGTLWQTSKARPVSYTHLTLPTKA